MLTSSKGNPISLTSRRQNKDKTKFIYDLNIYQLEQLDADGEYRHMGPWYIHVYEYTDGNIEEVTAPIELTEDEYNSIIRDDPYYDEPDVWYGLEGFLFENWTTLSDRLKMVFETLPKYKAEVLF
jgi:hypothetical protein